jgi:hypothetical protein
MSLSRAKAPLAARSSALPESCELDYWALSPKVRGPYDGTPRWSPWPAPGGLAASAGVEAPRRFVSVPFSVLGGPGLMPLPWRERHNLGRLLRSGEARHGPGRPALAIGLQVRRSQTEAPRAPAAEGVPLLGDAIDVFAAATRRADTGGSHRRAPSGAWGRRGWGGRGSNRDIRQLRGNGSTMGSLGVATVETYAPLSGRSLMGSVGMSGLGE